MKEIGFDMSAQEVHQLTPEMVDLADRVIVMGDTPGGPLPDFLASSPKLQSWDVPDPGYGEISHKGARDMIAERVAVLAREI